MVSEPVDALNYYLYYVWVEAKKRSYRFNRNMYISVSITETIEVTTKQLQFERSHLLGKLKIRDEKTNFVNAGYKVTLNGENQK